MATSKPEIELNEDPASTWGATDAYKEAWHAKYGSDEDASAEAAKAPAAGTGSSTNTSDTSTASK